MKIKAYGESQYFASFGFDVTFFINSTNFTFTFWKKAITIVFRKS